MKRRQFLTLSGSTVAAVLLSRCASNNTTQARPSPTVISSKGGLLDVDLEALSMNTTLSGRQFHLLGYNDRIPGPLLQAQPGDTVRLRFTNRIGQPTNLHYHGLHVPPTGNADNVFLKIPSGETLTYEFTLPENHPAGLFWYHPHYHGYVADQVFGGLAGAFIVRGELDEIPEIKAATEHVLLLKDYDPDAGRIGSSATTGMMGAHMAQMRGREGAVVTVNGEIQPTFNLSAGGLLRLRLLNASSSRFYRLSLEEHPFYLIATDGGAIAEPVELRELLLSPGERAEVLVRGDREPGQYRLLNLPYDRGGMGMMGGMMGRGPGGGMMGRGPGGSANVTETLATITYHGQTDVLPLPKTLIPVETLPEPTQTRRFLLNHGMNPGRGMVFLINGRAFDHQRIDTTVGLNTVEEWELINTGVMDHPFHLHTNHFQIASVNGTPPPYRAWKDTVLVPFGQSVRIRIPFRDFGGKTVYHCHILDHEDLGMMGMLAIQDEVAIVK
jgi:FtsP/CotA-like multicopper oxidase with cupredoxin domain